MKLTPGQKQLGAPASVPGQYYIRATKHGLVLQKWPKKRDGKKTPAQFYKETEFALAAQYASNPSPYDLASAIEAAKGTTMVPRDFITGCCYGTLVEFQGDPNFNWVSYRSVTVNGQLVLDQVTDDTPSMMWRAPVGWVGFQPTAAEQVPVFRDGVIQFGQIVPPPTPYDAGAGAPTLPYWDNSEMYLVPPSVGGGALNTLVMTANRIYFVPLIIPYTRRFTSIAINIPGGGSIAASNARLGIYLLDTVKGGPGAVALDAGNVTTSVTGLRAIAIDQILARGVYFVAVWTSAAITVRGLTNTFGLASCGFALGNASPAPCNYLVRTTTFGTAYVDQSANSQTTNTASGTIPIIGLR